MKKKKKNDSGLSLIELIIAISLFAMVAAPLMGGFANAMRMQRRAMVHTLATYTAQLMLEEAYGMGAEEFIATYGNESGDVAGDFDGTMEFGYVFTATRSRDWGDLGFVDLTITITNAAFMVESTLTNLIQVPGDLETGPIPMPVSTATPIPAATPTPTVAGSPGSIPHPNNDFHYSNCTHISADGSCGCGTAPGSPCGEPIGVPVDWPEYKMSCCGFSYSWGVAI
jgi:prepilin-type N-terminal cleavage/methylation domain-containing protein